MNRTFKVWIGVTVAALAVAVLTPAALAQCGSARIFGGHAGGMFEPKLNVLTGGTENAGNEVGYFWENGVGSANDSIGGGGGVGCPSSLWWQVLGADRRIAGSIASPACQMDVCPAPGASLNFIVEDATADGSDAGVIMFQVDETPAAFRWWDHARVRPGYQPNDGVSVPGSHTVTMERYPTVDVTGSSGPPPGTTVTNNYLNLALNYQGVSGPAHTPNPASTGIAAYDIMGHNGATDPGRTRGAWNQGVVAQVAYVDAAVAGHNVAVTCPDPTDNTFLAVGIEFVDGVKSALVGSAVAVACDPNIADPDDDNRLRPKSRKKKPGRVGR
jgi:hypothetical protein